MGLSAKQLKAGLDAVARLEPGFASALKLAGYPEPRIRPRGYGTLMRTIVGQQVSVAAAASMWRKFEAHAGEELDPRRVLDADFDTLRACGLSRQKQGYMRSLCDLVITGQLDFEALPSDDEDAITQLTQIKGIGRWSAEIYLLFAEGRQDIWPAGDLAVQAGLHKLLGLDARPSEKATRDMAEKWRPHRGATAIFTWHCYNNPAL
ncbi:MAG: DNA-3-methyladenine glycosylase 2 family protein [Novosphingobium sp.]|uniref:DNA-3-methyladenine glycosylase family protein n=1 Tax=Novosphingobium sp. TaxID=1874826 RepID=UPI0032BC0865